MNVQKYKRNYTLYLRKLKNFFTDMTKQALILPATRGMTSNVNIDF